MTAVNPYEVLGVGRKARLPEIRRAFRRLARRFHPDLNPGDRRAEERFQQIHEAWLVLSDPQRRKACDRQMEGGAAPARPQASRRGREAAEPAVEAEPEGAFSIFFSEFFADPRATRPDRAAPRRGDDVTRAISIGFFDALRGLRTTIEIDAESACRTCGGSGRVPSAMRRPCPECAGTGRISRYPGTLRLSTACRRCDGEGSLAWDGCGSCSGAGVLTRRERLEVAIPAGVDDGSRVRVPGCGRAGRNGGDPGDLSLITRVAAHPFFRRIGDNIHCTVPVTVSEAALGARIEVPTIDGRSRIRIPPGTETGKKFRLRGQGAPSLRGTARGDQYVEIRIATPGRRSERARRLLEELGAVESGDDLRRRAFEREPAAT